MRAHPFESNTQPAARYPRTCSLERIGDLDLADRLRLSHQDKQHLSREAHRRRRDALRGGKRGFTPVLVQNLYRNALYNTPVKYVSFAHRRRRQGTGAFTSVPTRPLVPTHRVCSLRVRLGYHGMGRGGQAGFSLQIELYFLRRHLRMDQSAVRLRRHQFF